jgi:hypothetical protein
MSSHRLDRRTPELKQDNENQMRVRVAVLVQTNTF